MVARSALLTLTLFVASIFAAPNALAADGDPKVEFEKAVRFFKAGELEAALPHFRRSYELSKHRPSTILGLAQCERALKLYDDAIAHFKEYLASKPAPADSASVTETMHMVEELRSEMNATPEVPSEPGAAKVETPPPVESKEAPPEAPPKAPEPAKTDNQTPAAVVTPPPPKEEQGSIVESPIFWIVTGVVVIAGGTAAFFALRSGGKENPYTGSSGVFIQGP